MTIRLAIVEDHPALADGLATLIRGSPDVEVVGTAPDVRQATALLEREIAGRRAVRHPPRTTAMTASTSSVASRRGLPSSC